MIGRLRAAGGWLYRVSDRALVAAFLIGVLSSPFDHVAYFRSALIGHASVAPAAGLAVTALGLALAWRSLLRRDFTWADPARLTWADAADDRVARIGRRMWGGWAVRFAAVGYVTAVGAVLLGGSSWLMPGSALLVAVALLAAVLARRSPGRVERLLEPVFVVAAAVLAGVATVTGVGPVVLWALAGGALLIAIASLAGSGPVRRPAIATSAGRAGLVRGHLRRLVRRVSVAFGDLLALLPPPERTPWASLLAGRAAVLRFMVGGIVARRPALLPVVLCAVAVAVLHRVFPLVSPLWLVGVGVYVACLPFAAPLAALFGVPGLRRWFGCPDLTLRLAAAAVVVVAAAAWLGLVGALAVPVPPVAWLAVPLAVGAVLRTVTRAPLDYGNVGATAPGGVLLPVGLLVQLVHGPELLVIGLVVLGSGMALAAAGPLVLGLAAYGVAR